MPKIKIGENVPKRWLNLRNVLRKIKRTKLLLCEEHHLNQQKTRKHTLKTETCDK